MDRICSIKGCSQNIGISCQCSVYCCEDHLNQLGEDASSKNFLIKLNSDDLEIIRQDFRKTKSKFRDSIRLINTLTSQLLNQIIKESNKVISDIRKIELNYMEVLKQAYSGKEVNKFHYEAAKKFNFAPDSSTFFSHLSDEISSFYKLEEIQSKTIFESTMKSNKLVIENTFQISFFSDPELTNNLLLIHKKASRLNNSNLDLLSENDLSDINTILSKRNYRIPDNLSDISRANSSNQSSGYFKNQKLMKKDAKFDFKVGKIKLKSQRRNSLRVQKPLETIKEVVQLELNHDSSNYLTFIAFARCFRDQITIIIQNSNQESILGHFEISKLSKFLPDKGVSVYKIEDWFNKTKQQYYFREELLCENFQVSLIPHESYIISIYPTKINSEEALAYSLKRLEENIEIDGALDKNYLIQKLKSLLSTDIKKNIQSIVTVIIKIQKNILNQFKISPEIFIQKLNSFDEYHLGKIFGVCDFITKSSVSDRSLLGFAKNVAEMKKIGPIVFSTPELGRFSMTGGLGMMVDELAQALALLGEEVWIISPYYERNRKGETGYLAKYNIKWKFNINVEFGGEVHIMGMHRGYEKGVNLIFLHNFNLFPHIYVDAAPHFIIKQLVGWGKGVLEALHKLRIAPSIIITNDWFTGLTPAYGKQGVYKKFYENTTFLHILHNLDPNNEGRLFTAPLDNYFYEIHELPREILINPHWVREIVNPSRCAIMMSDQWATVSPSYKEEIKNSSPLSDLLNSKPQPFAYSNGICIPKRLQKIQGQSHLETKEILQKKYFGLKELDDSIVLFGFIGRITEQKGIHLILEAAETMIPATSFKVQFIVGGQAVSSEKYSVNCAKTMRSLRTRYPKNFFADPDRFFFEGHLVNLGCDFGLMPSLFEPGGIVQHEFFIASTPVIAFKTGGLKDTVHEFDPNSSKGCGFLFEDYNSGSFMYAIKKAIKVFKNKALFECLRRNSFKATIDGDKVARAWNKEFYRLRGNTYYDNTAKNQVKELLQGTEIPEIEESLQENSNQNYYFKRKNTEF